MLFTLKSGQEQNIDGNRGGRVNEVPLQSVAKKGKSSSFKHVRISEMLDMQASKNDASLGYANFFGGI